VAWCRRRSHLRTEMGVRRRKVMLYIPFFKDSLAYIPRPLSGLLRMSVEEGSAPNSGSGGSTLLGLASDWDEVEDRTRDFASLACLLARVSAKDILLSATSANTVDYYSCLKYTYSFPLSVQPAVPLTNNVLLYCWATLIRLPTKVRIYD
jgi:hypothetical protein